MSNQIPTHCAITMAASSKLSNSIRKARAILKLIQHDGTTDDDLEGSFYTNEEIIRDALDAVQEYLEQAEQSSKVDFYFVNGGKNE